MDFSLEDHQDQLLRSVERWLRRSWSAGDVLSSTVRRERWAELVSYGWTAMLAHNADAVSGVLDAALLVEALAAGGCTLPVTPGGMIAPLLAAHAGLTAASGVDQLVVMDETHPDPTARGLEIADRVIVLRAAPDNSGRIWSVAAVAVQPGTVEPVQDEGRTVLSRLTSLDNAEFWEIDRVAAEQAWLAGAVFSAAELVGLASAVLDDCVAYAKVRVQGGKAIGGHQAIQHRLADMLGDIERARYLTYLAATSVEEGGPPTAVHQAKALAARDCLAAIRSAHQVMGAIAYSVEHQLHHFHKQAVVAAHEFGSAAWHWAALEQSRRRII